MALKREATSSMFDSLKTTTVSSPEKPKKEEKVSEPAKEIVKEVVKPVEKKKSQPKPTTQKTEKKKETTTEIKGFDFALGKKEKKDVRKQFVFTKSDAAWLKETAKLNGISENKVIENLIKMAKDMQ